MDSNDIDYEQLINDLENGTFVPTANEDAPQPLYTPYSCWAEMLEMDECAYDAVCSQYLEFIKSRQDKQLREALEKTRKLYGFSVAQLPYDVMKEFFDMVFSDTGEHSDLVKYCCTTPDEFIPDEIVPYEDMDWEDFCMFLEHLFELLSFSVLHYWLSHTERESHRRAEILIAQAEISLSEIGYSEQYWR